MKKYLLTSAIVLGLMASMNSTSFAQNDSDFQIGGGLIYGTEVEALGIQAGAKYGFTNEISATADFAIYFPDDYDWWTINVNGHYHFINEDRMKVYGLAGLNYATIEVGFLGTSTSDSEVGLNIGGGAEFALGFVDLYTEAKYILGDADQLAISAGLRFTL
ncbi:MAG: outer membrane beta-barrel protein [Bacteroidota bacterium]